tara:strand:- start:261 stop:446 length:186 start_codon:yes stop_codon:yes gene_type:complete
MTEKQQSVLDTISRIRSESNKISNLEVLALKKEYGVSIYYLITGKGDIFLPIKDDNRGKRL